MDLLSVVCTFCPCRLQYLTCFTKIIRMCAYYKCCNYNMHMVTECGCVSGLTCIVASVDSNSLDCSIRMRSWVATLERSETKTLVPASCRQRGDFSQTKQQMQDHQKKIFHMCKHLRNCCVFVHASNECTYFCMVLAELITTMI